MQLFYLHYYYFITIILLFSLALRVLIKFTLNTILPLLTWTKVVIVHFISNVFFLHFFMPFFSLSLYCLSNIFLKYIPCVSEKQTPLSKNFSFYFPVQKFPFCSSNVKQKLSEIKKRTALRSVKLFRKYSFFFFFSLWFTNNIFFQKERESNLNLCRTIDIFCK